MDVYRHLRRQCRSFRSLRQVPNIYDTLGDSLSMLGYGDPLMAELSSGILTKTSSHLTKKAYIAQI